MTKLAVAGLLVAAAADAWAICPRPVPRACSAYFEHDVVFAGTVVSIKESASAVELRLHVTRTLHGDVGSMVTVFSDNDSARLLWAVGEEHVVFASRELDGRLEASDDCGPLSESGRVAEIVSQIATLRGISDSAVEGNVLAAQPDGSGVSSVWIEVSGANGTFAVKSDTKGHFVVRVPPGRYEVAVDPSVARQSDYSWVDPSDVVLAPGQCAQFQFVTVRRCSKVR